MKKLILIVAALTLVSCAKRDAVDFASPASISITRHLLHGGPGRAGQKAIKHCNKYGKDAELISRTPDFSGYFETMNFRCVVR